MCAVVWFVAWSYSYRRHMHVPFKGMHCMCCMYTYKAKEKYKNGIMEISRCKVNEECTIKTRFHYHNGLLPPHAHRTQCAVAAAWYKL